MKFVFRISGDMNCSEPVEDSDTGSPSSITVTWSTYVFFNTDIVNFVWKIDDGEAESIFFVNFCFFAVLESSVDEGWWGWVESLI